MQQVRVHDKWFDRFISADQIEARIDALAGQLNQRYTDSRPLLIVVLNGAFVFAADLVRRLTCQPEVRFVRISTYGDSMTSQTAPEVLMADELHVAGREVLIVEDIVDSGHTVHFFRQYLRQANPRSLDLITLLYKPDSFRYDEAPQYVGFEIDPSFVVGYGMDYAQAGRQLPDIYRLHT
ncbi:MAG: hypoxanthine phosphoribosyltransferase [Bacteroidia bacterium]